MASTGEVWRLGHRPALDGVRGIAILLVIAFHAGIPGTTSGGAVGVTVFFTLSGFLITALLLEERATTGRVSLRGFYLRRALRLAPALVVMVAVLVALGSVGVTLVEPVDALPVLLYFSNWIRAGFLTLGGFDHTWSLAIEEQFYLVWPLVLLAAARWRGARAVAAVALVGWVGSVVLRVALWDGTIPTAYRIYYGTDTRLDGLMAGCALAAVCHIARLRSVRGGGWVAAVAVGALLVAGSQRYGTVGTYLVLPTVIPILAVVVTAALTVTDRAPAWATAGWLRWVGTRSYALYLWHYPLFDLRDRTAGAGVAATAVTLLVVGVVAEVSWRLVEQPCLRLRSRRRSADRVEGTGGHPVGILSR